MKYAILFRARHIAICEIFNSLEDAIKFRKEIYDNGEDYIIIQIW